MCRLKICFSLRLLLNSRVFKRTAYEINSVARSIMRGTMGVAYLFHLLMLLQVLQQSSSVEADCSDFSTYQSICKDRSKKPVSLIQGKPKDALDSLCTASSEMLDCLKGHVDQCSTLAPPGSVSDKYMDGSVIERAESQFHQFCKDDDFRSDFVKYSRCLKTTLYCLIHIKTSIQLMDGLQSLGQPGNDNADVTAKICRSLDKYTTCVSFVVKTMCPEESRSFASKYAEQAIPTEKGELCGKIINN